MGKLISYKHVGYVQGILQDFIVMTVTESSVLDLNQPHYFPAEEWVLDQIDIGDIIKICFLCREELIEKDREEIRLSPDLIKFERWNESEEIWDLLDVVTPQVPTT